MSTSDESQIAARLIQLEEQQRRLRRITVGLICLLPLGLGAFASRPFAPVVQAERVELVTESGARQAILSADSNGINLTLLGPKGRPASSIRLGDDATLTVMDATGRVMTTLGGPTVRHITK